MNHTPGPWKIGKTVSDQPTVESVHDNRLVVALTMRNGGESYANAKLIREAPRMLEVLKYVYGRLPEHDTKSAQQIRSVIFDATEEMLE